MRELKGFWKIVKITPVVVKYLFERQLLLKSEYSIFPSTVMKMLSGFELKECQCHNLPLLFRVLLVVFMD